MIKLLTIVIVAGLIYESHQQGNGSPKSENPQNKGVASHFNPVKPGCSAGWPCYYPTYIQCWTPWFEKTDSSEDDSKTFQRLHREHPEKICHNPIDIETDTESSDVKIRFSCYPPFCGGGVCWSDWVETDRSGDSVSATNDEYDCKQPLYIEAATIDTMIPAFDTGEIFQTLNPTGGLLCKDGDQGSGKTCSDYKVRFGCSCTDFAIYYY